MDYNKLRYDLALQAATARLIMCGKDDDSESDCKCLLGLFAVCYKEFKHISDQDIKQIFQD